MSRVTIYRDKRFTVVTGVDHALGNFLQVFDRDMLDETPEGEGLVLDWSQFFGIEINRTGIPGNDPLEISKKYLEDNDVELKT
jgi:hypothetical protein